MTLTLNCKSCRQAITFNEWVSDRVHLARKRGEYIDMECKKCGHKDKYHVDNVTAESSRFILILSSTIFLVGTQLMVYLIWKNIGSVNHPYAIAGLLGGGLIPILIYMTISKSQRERQRVFNRYKVKS